MIRKWGIARRLTRVEWNLLFRAWGLLLLVDVGLRMRFPLRMRISAEALRTSNSSSDPAPIQRVSRMVNMASRHHLFRMTCLRRALVLQRLLVQCGVSTRMQIGVNKEAERLGAHAWVEYDGRPINESPAVAGRYAPLAGLGGKR